MIHTRHVHVILVAIFIVSHQPRQVPTVIDEPAAQTHSANLRMVVDHADQHRPGRRRLLELIQKPHGRQHIRRRAGARRKGGHDAVAVVVALHMHELLRKCGGAVDSLAPKRLAGQKFARGGGRLIDPSDSPQQQSLLFG